MADIPSWHTEVAQKTAPKYVMFTSGTPVKLTFLSSVPIKKEATKDGKSIIFYQWKVEVEGGE